MSIELVPFARAELTVASPTIIGPAFGGNRVVGEITDAVWTGERFKARQFGSAAADWAILSNEGVGEIDVRATLKTDDGALVYTHYLGRLLMLADGPLLYTAPLFETSDPRYTWINRIQFVAKGAIQADGKLVYEVYELR